MQLSLALVALSAFVNSAVANPVVSSRPGFALAGRSEDGAYTLDKHGNIASFVSADTLHRRMEERGLPDITERKGAAELSKRLNASAGIACFQAQFSGGDKLNAVNAMFSLLDDYNIVPAGGAIATQFGEPCLPDDHRYGTSRLTLAVTLSERHRLCLQLQHCGVPDGQRE